jgi:hypothetical protein
MSAITILTVPPFSTLCNSAFALRREVFVWEQKSPRKRGKTTPTTSRPPISSQSPKARLWARCAYSTSLSTSRSAASRCGPPSRPGRRQTDDGRRHGPCPRPGTRALLSHLPIRQAGVLRKARLCRLRPRIPGMAACPTAPCAPMTAKRPCSPERNCTRLVNQLAPISLPHCPACPVIALALLSAMSGVPRANGASALQEQKTAQGGGEGRPRLRAGLFNFVPEQAGKSFRNISRRRDVDPCIMGRTVRHPRKFCTARPCSPNR